jgi:hypothetical protein
MIDQAYHPKVHEKLAYSGYAAVFHVPGNPGLVEQDNGLDSDQVQQEESRNENGPAAQIHPPCAVRSQ